MIKKQRYIYLKANISSPVIGQEASRLMSDSNALKSFVITNQGQEFNESSGAAILVEMRFKQKNSLSFLHFQPSTRLGSWFDSLASQALNNRQLWWRLVIGFKHHNGSEVPELNVLTRLWLVVAYGQPELPQTVFVQCRPLVVFRVTLSAAWGGFSTGHAPHHCSRGQLSKAI